LGKKVALVLVLEDEVELHEFYDYYFKELGIKVMMAVSPAKAEPLLMQYQFDMVISDIQMPKKNGIQFLQEMREKLSPLPRWFFVTADVSPETMERACALGAIDVLIKPLDLDLLKSLIERAENQNENPLHEVMDLVQSISGVQLGKEKKKLVETRLLRRSRLLGLKGVEEYIEYFKKNRKDEVRELISIVTTHTTEFFREPDHFDFLFERIFPKLLKEQQITIWSAACSSGQEVFSLAIAWCEFLKSRGLTLERGPRIEFLGTDIDFSTLEHASKGIYSVKWLANMNQKLQNTYFDFGSDDLAGLVKIKDFIHRLCRFEQRNLLSNSFNQKDVDVIFLRNVLIYFKSKDIENIINRIEKSLKPDGVLFIGHSESLSNLNVPYKIVGNSVYQSNRSLQSLAPEVNTAATVTKPIRVLIVDDSKLIRRMLMKIISADPSFEVVGEAENPIEADKYLEKNSIDLMTLDVHMPEMNGITYLQKLKDRKTKFPIVMISSASYEDAVDALHCFDLGAVDYIEKPQGDNLNFEAERIRTVLRSAVISKRIRVNQAESANSLNTKSERSTVTSPRRVSYQKNGNKDIILIGASTGGIQAVRDLLMDFPQETPPILIVQHIPPNFSKAFAKRLNDCCKFKVVEAQNGMIVEPNCAYIAAGGMQMGILREGSRLRLDLNDDPPVSRHKPSVDYLFNSVVKVLDKNWDVVACILTGMGADGADGIRKLKELGVHTIAQDEESCVVFGMPQKAIEGGGVIEVLPLPSIAYHIFKRFGRAYSAAG
jgi:two-component system chemotaxis response regulator CheB